MKNDTFLQVTFDSSEEEATYREMQCTRGCMSLVIHSI